MALFHPFPGWLIYYLFCVCLHDTSCFIHSPVDGHWVLSPSAAVWIVLEWTQACVCMRSQSSDLPPHGADIKRGAPLRVTAVTQKAEQGPSPGVGGRGSATLTPFLCCRQSRGNCQLWSWRIVHWILVFLGIRGGGPPRPSWALGKEARK